ncbi:hypothetical protein I4U23_019094 [Adineta vaga]|nr:hypothetical protein I4U23_019094 [Adineta vaga]
MLKLTSMSNTLPPINTHARSSLDDLRTDGPGETVENSIVTKQQHLRGQQPVDPQRRNLMRSNRLVPSTGNKFMSTSQAVVPTVSSPFASVSSLIRSPSILHTGSPAQNELNKGIYRSSDCVWNEHQNNLNAPNTHLRSNSPIKNKLVALSQRLSNGIVHENAVVGLTGKSMAQVPISPQLHHTRDVPTHADLLLSSTPKSYHAMRRRHTNSFLDKAPGIVDYSVSMRKETDRSQVFNNGLRTRQMSSKQRNYVSSKTSFCDVNEKDIHTNMPLGGNTPPINPISNTQRLHESTYDLSTNRKPFSSNKSRSFNVPANNSSQQVHYNSTQNIHSNEPVHERTDYTNFGLGRRTSKEQITPTTKYRRASGDQSVTTVTAVAAPPPPPSVVTYTSGVRHPSAQSYESRNPNISYAYTNVKKYIEENALMSPEKEQVIRKWIMNVEKYRHDFGNVD